MSGNKLSDFIHWISKSSDGVSDRYNLVHFVIKDVDTILDHELSNIFRFLAICETCV